MFWQGVALGVMIGYALKKLLDGDYDYRAEIYQTGFEDGYADGYRDCQIEN